MGNMSYCRFENTADALRDCLNAINNNEHFDLNSYEMKGLLSIIEDARELYYMFGDQSEEDIKKQCFLDEED
jgi:hypothetical protein